MKDACGTARRVFRAYLQHQLQTPQSQAVRAHLDACADCWDRWNRYRWDAAAGDPLYEELRAFLGSDFRPYLDSSKALAAEWDAARPASHAEIRAFYARSQGYLYNLTIWEASGNRPSYVQDALPQLKGLAPRSIADFGCGIGSDTIRLRAHGFTVIPYELPSPHATFASWRFQRRSQPLDVTDPADPRPGCQPQALWLIDTLDHLPDINASLGPLLRSVQLMVTEKLTMSRGHGAQRFHTRRPFAALRATLATYGLHPNTTAPAHQVMIWRRSPTT